MTRLTLVPIIALVTCLAAARALAEDCKGCKDVPGVSRMPGYYLNNNLNWDRQFDAFEFKVTRDGKEAKQKVEGRAYSLRYDIEAGKVRASPLQIVRNYQNAARQAKGETLSEWVYSGPNDRFTTVRFNRGPTEVWIQVHPSDDGGCYWLEIVEKQAMQQDVAFDPKAMADALASVGHVEIPGIFFDFNKSVVKPESDPALKQVAELLRGKPSLKVWVVGHTDAVGTVEANLTLSRARAAAVIAALKQKYGVDASRLAPFGNGPYAPVASNETEESRAHNRRVELVGHP